MNEARKKFVMPVAGRLPRHPVTGARYRRDGEWVDYIPEIARQLRDGDIVETTPPDTTPSGEQPKPRRSKTGGRKQ